MVQVSFVPLWRVIWLVVWSLTPSIISISPARGQFGPTVQKLGHVEQPTGMLEASMTKRPPL